MSDELKRKGNEPERGQERKEAENIIWEEIFFDESHDSKQEKGVKDAIDQIKQQDVRELMEGFRSQEQGE